MKNKINDIIYDTLASVENDLDASVELSRKEIETAKASINWFVMVLRDKVSDEFIGDEISDKKLLKEDLKKYINENVQYIGPKEEGHYELIHLDFDSFIEDLLFKL